MTGEADAIRIWLREARANSHLQLDRVALADCAQWLYRDGGLHHATGRFFSIVGLEVKDVGEARHGRQLAMIDQPEVGWLGFIIRRTPHGIEWLLQAKTEPGNIDATQLAPSIQATRSNYNRAHGGRPTEFLDLFRGAKAFVSDGPHSEQGTRFLWKFNRNSVLILPDGEAPDVSGLEHWKWCPSGSIRDLLADDYCVNTDARSVIATAPWALVADGGPLFSAPALAASYEQVVEPKELESLLDRINALPHGRVPRWQHIALDEMAGFSWGDSGLLDDKNDEQVACFEIRVRGREVDHWCQPFLMQKGQTDHVLLMRLTEKGSEFFVRLFHEVGFGTRVEYGPSLHSAFSIPEEMQGWQIGGDHSELVRIKQSDEGGRFMRADACYRIVLMENPAQRKQYPFGRWVSLAMLEELVSRPGTTTNELRTLASLALSRAFDRACTGLSG